MPISLEVGVSEEEYFQLVEQVHEVVRAVLPINSTVLVANTGDETLLAIDGRRAWSFPQIDSGKYPRYHLPNSAKAIAHLEELRDLGAEYFVIPTTAFWWLEDYEGFAEHLARYRLVARQYHVGLIFELDSNQAC